MWWTRDPDLAGTKNHSLVWLNIHCHQLQWSVALIVISALCDCHRRASPPSWHIFPSSCLTWAMNRTPCLWWNQSQEICPSGHWFHPARWAHEAIALQPCGCLPQVVGEQRDATVVLWISWERKISQRKQDWFWINKNRVKFPGIIWFKVSIHLRHHQHLSRGVECLLHAVQL